MNKSETQLVKFNVHDLTAGLNDDWKNFVVSEVNDHVVRLSLLQRDFHWHSHSKSSGGNGELTVLADPTLVFDEVRFVVPEQFDYKNWSEYAVASLSINVPEPATLLLLGFGILGIAGLRRKS